MALGRKLTTEEKSGLKKIGIVGRRFRDKMFGGSYRESIVGKTVGGFAPLGSALEKLTRPKKKSKTQIKLTKY